MNNDTNFLSKIVKLKKETFAFKNGEIVSKDPKLGCLKSPHQFFQAASSGHSVEIQKTFQLIARFPSIYATHLFLPKH